MKSQKKIREETETTANGFQNWAMTPELWHKNI
jgi:hypothetical protein